MAPEHGHHNDDHHDHDEGGHGHTHGAVDPSIATSERGIWAVKWSFVVLFATALVQIVVVVLSASIALLSDIIHNFGVAATAIPLWIAFALSRLGTSRRFTYGYGRFEDLAGVMVVLIILFSAVVAGYQAIERLLNPQPVGAPLGGGCGRLGRLRGQRRGGRLPHTRGEADRQCCAHRRRVSCEDRRLDEPSRGGGGCRGLARLPYSRPPGRASDRRGDPDNRVAVSQDGVHPPPGRRGPGDHGRDPARSEPRGRRRGCLRG